jgi:hypothetical protein
MRFLKVKRRKSQSVSQSSVNAKEIVLDGMPLLTASFQTTEGTRINEAAAPPTAVTTVS